MKNLNNKKGFTLIEMLGVIVIMGLITIIVFPTISKMIHNNRNQKYEYYDEVIKEGIEAYATAHRTELGGSKYQGCVKVNLQTLIINGYVTKFSDEKISCATGTNDIKIRNDKGKLSYKYKLTCMQDTKEVFSKGEEDTAACNPYVLKEEKNLASYIDADTSLTKSAVGKEKYVTAGSSNYVYYSGQLWRIFSYNTSTDVTKAIAVSTSTISKFSSVGQLNFANSDVESWLNNDFYSQLTSPEKYIVSTSFNTTPNNDPNSNPIVQEKVRKAKVGLLSLYEYNKIKDWWNGTGTSTLLVTEGSAKAKYYNSKTNVIEETSAKGARAYHAVVSFDSDIMVQSGAGTLTNPYIIEKSFCKANDEISKCSVGEYIQFSGDSKKYRIIYKDNKVVKLMTMFSSGKTIFSDNHYDYSTSELKKVLETKINSSLIVKSDYCVVISGDNSNALVSKCQSGDKKISSVKVAPPRLGELFVGNIEGITSPYWTLNLRTGEVDGEGSEFEAVYYTVNNYGVITNAIIDMEFESVGTFFIPATTKVKNRSMQYIELNI